MENYPAIAFIVKYGKTLAIVVGVLPPILLGQLLFAIGLHWGWSLLMLALIPLAYLVARGGIELVMVVADMLLPK